MSLIATLLIILAGIVLLLIELLIIPGISVFGIAGFVCMIGGVIASYIYHGSTTGTIMLVFTVLASVLSIVFAFRRKTWKRAGLKASIDSRIIAIEPGTVAAGDSGKTTTRLAPMGKVMVGEKIYEAKSIAGYVNENTEIIVVKISQNQLIVKPKI